LAKSFRNFLVVIGAVLVTSQLSVASNLAIRLGLWHLTKPDFTNEQGITSENKRNFFYLEASYQSRLNRLLTFNVNLGTIFRGTIRHQTSNGIILGSANVLPIGVGFTLYPIPVNIGIKPYFRGGGTVAIGNSNSGNFSGFDAYGNPIFDSKTRLTAGGFGAFGFSHRIMTKISLLTEISYYHLKFSGPVAGISNHSGYQVLAGLSINYK